MPPVIQSMIRDELSSRRHKLEEALVAVGENRELERLLGEVDAALKRLADESYGLCETCHDPIEPDRLLADPLTRFCLDHLTASEQRALEQDLELAARIQRGLLPKHDAGLAGWEMAYHYEPLGPVSGDYCDLLPCGGRLFFALGDASGKGVAASMLMAQLNAMFRTLTAVGLPLAEMLEQASRVFCESTLPSHYATLVCGWAGADGDVELCNAGHPPPIHARLGEASEVKAAGLPLGLFCREEFPSEHVRMAPGDSLLLYSDGLTEAASPAGEEYGRERLLQLVRDCAGLPPHQLLETCLMEERAFRGAAPRKDDLTVLVLRRAP